MPVVLAGVALIALLALLVAYGFSQLARSHSGGFLGWFENQVVATVVGGGWIAKQVLKLTSWITHELGKHAKELEHVGVQWIAGLSQYLYLMARATVPWPFTLSQALYWLVRSEIPRLLRALPSRVEHVVKYITKELPAIRKTIYKFPKLTKAQIATALAAALPASFLADLALLRWIRRHFTAIEHAAAHAGEIALPLPRVIIHDLPVPWGRTITQIRKRLKRVERLLGVSGMAVAMAAVLGLPNWRCLTRGNIGRAARHFCGIDRWLVDLLLLGSVEAFIATDLCGFTDLLIREAENISPALLELVDVEDALVGCHGTVKPIDLRLPPLSLSPMPGPSALAA